MVTWQIKNVISPLSQDLCTPNLGVWWLWIKEPHPQSQVRHRPLGHVTAQRRYISTFMRPMDPKVSRILVILWLLRQRFAQKEIGWPNYQLISILLCQNKYNIFTVKEAAWTQWKACACRKCQLELRVFRWTRSWVIQKFICITASVNPGALKLEETTNEGVQ